MARTPDMAGALEAVIARTIKATIGPRFRKIDTQLRRLERRLRKLSVKRAAASGGGRKGRRGRRGAARRGGTRHRMTRRGRR
jgi:hypothetical protein